MSVSPTFSASNTRESWISCCTSALVVVLPAPWVPLSHTIMGPNASAVRAAGTSTAEIRSTDRRGRLGCPSFGAGTDAGKAAHHCTVIDTAGAKVLSRRVPNNEPELLELISDVLALAEESPVTRAVDLNADGGALLITLLVSHGQRPFTTPPAATEGTARPTRRMPTSSPTRRGCAAGSVDVTAAGCEWGRDASRSAAADLGHAPLRSVGLWCPDCLPWPCPRA
ncbi:transposase [Streptomyces sp. NPDC002668]|uniref:IS110 family transposase n=1 Tax=Streptomyces sp. NPDC002668 TaxID=3154422 RepID=UPI00331B97D5